MPYDNVNFHGSYSKFNIIEDMGNGHAAFVNVVDVQGPVYVYKVPKGGI